MRHSTTALLALLASTVSAAVSDWQQCGGSNWSGETACDSNSGCVKINDYYSQCQPGAAPAPAPKPSSTLSTIPSTLTTTSPLASTVGPGRTLQSGYYWIRAVAAPNFHKYMQTSPIYTTGPALLGASPTAGQFQVVDGQLVQLISSPGAPTKLLYANVSDKRVINDMSLAVTFSETKNTYGVFKWGGDDLQWSVEGVQRPNRSAWLCGSDDSLL
ncbi:carbohydrate-binding module family 1 protein [Stemphylium lycopersici]|nr:carbohydrate-binding module family 1 protein [Stemphylium lycopersici]